MSYHSRRLGVGVLLLFSDALGLCPFGFGASRLLVSISGPKCKILHGAPNTHDKPGSLTCPV